MNQDSGSDLNVKVGGNANTKIAKNAYTVVDGDVRILIKGDLNVAVEGEIKVKAKGDVQIEGNDTKIEARGGNVLKAGRVVLTEGPLTFFDSPFTTGNFIRAHYSELTEIAAGIGVVVPIPVIPAPSVDFEENDADNKSDLVTSFTPKEGYIFNGDSVVEGTKRAQDLYKPTADSDGKLVVLSHALGQKAKLYEALPTGQLEDATLVYKSKGGSITTWKVKRPVHKKGRFIEAGRYSGNGNGGRDHWRFKKPGSKYPTPLILQIGTTQYLIIESGARHEAI
jgi:hypothetical protein